MIPKDVIKNIRRIQITTNRMVQDVFAGQYHSVFKGRGMEFDSVRQYQPGDEIRSIDWNVTARMGQPFVKKFVEERELTVMLMLDMSKSCSFATVNKLKSRIAAEICSLLAFSAIKNNDRVGFIGFTEKIEKFIPPRKGTSHVLRVIREALYFKPTGFKTDINAALKYLNQVTTRKTVVFIISDFYAPDYKKQLTIANKRHDIVAITITDPLEINLNRSGLVQLQDPETNQSFLVDTDDKQVRKIYERNSYEKLSFRNANLGASKVDCVNIRTDTPYFKSLYQFFRQREKRARV